MRADARRNRAKILDAARTVIAELGPDAGMDQIASQAGVAVGTLYRHYPTKSDLVAAVLAEYTDQITQVAEESWARCEAGDSPAGTLAGFLREVVRLSALNEAAKSAAPAMGASSEVDGSRAEAAIARIIERGVACGEIRPDLTTADIYMLVTSAPLDQPENVRERWAELVLPCLTVEAAGIAGADGGRSRS